MDAAELEMKIRNVGNPIKAISKESVDTFARSDASREIYSRKVFVGGLPIDVPESEIRNVFAAYGELIVDWPSRAARPHANCVGGTGYVFLVYVSEGSVHKLVNDCFEDDGRRFLFVNSPTMRDKPVQVRPWLLSDANYMPRPKMMIDPRCTVFLGGVTRPTRAADLAASLRRLVDDIAYCGVDIDPELGYPKGAARVTFASTRAYISALTTRFVDLPHADSVKRCEMKPYVLEDQPCDQCRGSDSGGRFARYFCPELNCLQYYCDSCWLAVHEKQPDHHHLAIASRRHHEPSEIYSLR